MLSKRGQQDGVAVGVNVVEKRPKDTPWAPQGEDFEAELQRRPEKAMREVGGRAGRGLSRKPGPESFWEQGGPLRGKGSDELGKAPS